MNWKNILFTCLIACVSISIDYVEQLYFQAPQLKTRVELHWENSVFIDSAQCIPWNKLYYSSLISAGFSPLHAQEIAHIQTVYQPSSPTRLKHLLCSELYKGLPLKYWEHIIDWNKTTYPIQQESYQKAELCKLPSWLRNRIQAYGKKLNGYYSRKQLHEVYGYSDWQGLNCKHPEIKLRPIVKKRIDSLIVEGHPYFQGICAGPSYYCDSIYPFRKYYVSKDTLVNYQ